MFLLEPFFVFHARGIVLEEEHGGFGEGPFEMGVADLLAAVTLSLPGGFFGALDQPGIGSEVLNPGEAVDLVDFIEHDHGEDWPDAMDRSEKHQRVGVMMFGVFQDMAFQAPLEMIDVVDQLEVDFDAPPDIGIGELFGNALSMSAIRDLPAELGQIVLGIGVLDVAEQVGPFTGEVVPPAEQVPGRAHSSRIDISLGDHACPEQAGDLPGIDLVVFDLGSVDGFHVEGMA